MLLLDKVHKWPLPSLTRICENGKLKMENLSVVGRLFLVVPVGLVRLGHLGHLGRLGEIGVIGNLGSVENLGSLRNCKAPSLSSLTSLISLSSHPVLPSHPTLLVGGACGWRG